MNFVFTSFVYAVILQAYPKKDSRLMAQTNPHRPDHLREKKENSTRIFANVKDLVLGLAGLSAVAFATIASFAIFFLEIYRCVVMNTCGPIDWISHLVIIWMGIILAAILNQLNGGPRGRNGHNGHTPI
jgi:hypothetical protein